MKTLARSAWVRLALDSIIIGFLLIGAVYFFSNEAAATEHPELPSIKIEFLP